MYALRRLLFRIKQFILCIIITVSVKMYAQTSNCNATLEVESNITAKMASDAGTSYILELTNTGIEKAIFNIEVVNIDVKNKSNSFQLKNELRDKNYKTFVSSHPNNVNSNGAINRNKYAHKKSSYSIALNKNEVFKFYVNQIVKNGAVEGSKNTSKVIVTTKECPEFIVETFMQTEFKNFSAQ